MNKYEKFVKDAHAFLEHAFKNNIPPEVIIVTLSHDIYGLAADERLMVPRVDNYSVENPPVLTNSSDGVLKAIIHYRNEEAAV